MSDHDKHGALLALAETWCEAQSRVKSDPMAPIWERRAKMLREGYKPQLVSAPSATAAILEPGESPAKQAAFDAFYAAAKAEIPHNKDGTHSGTFFHALLCGIEAYLQSARTEIAPTPEGLARSSAQPAEVGALLPGLEDALSRLPPNTDAHEIIKARIERIGGPSKP